MNDFSGTGKTTPRLSEEQRPYIPAGRGRDAGSCVGGTSAGMLDYFHDDEE